jgi:hypothetical protein
MLSDLVSLSPSLKQMTLYDLLLFPLQLSHTMAALDYFDIYLFSIFAYVQENDPNFYSF